MKPTVYRSLAVVASLHMIFVIISLVRADATLDSIAESYVRLTLRARQYDEYMVDSYFGLAEWKPSLPVEENSEPPFDEFLTEARTLAEDLSSIDTSQSEGRRFSMSLSPIMAVDNVVGYGVSLKVQSPISTAL